MSTDNDALSPGDGTIIDAFERAIPEPSPEQLALERKAHTYRAQLQARLREPTHLEAERLYLLLQRLGRLMTLESMDTRVSELEDRVRLSVMKTLAEIDPRWNTRGLTRDDYVRLEQLHRGQEDQMFANYDAEENA
jgi:hypothetical protein